MTVEDFEDKFDIMPCASLYYELWKYYKRVRTILVSDLNTFRISCAHGTITGLNCSELSSSRIPSWLDQYIESVGKSLNLFNYAELNVAMARHIKDKANDARCECATISSQTLRNFWEALESIVDGCFEEVCLFTVIYCATHDGETFHRQSQLYPLWRNERIGILKLKLIQFHPRLNLSKYLTRAL